MIKHILYLFLVLCSSTLLIAQNNAIFNGGTADGYNRSCFTQSSNLNVTMSKGGSGDGFSKDCYTQISNLNPSLSKGGSGDGYAKDCYTQSPVLTVNFSGGSNDGYAKDCYTQASNLNAIFSGGVGGDGQLNGCANEPLGCYLTINLGNDTTFCDGQTLTLDAGSFPGGATYLWQDGSTAQTFLVDTSGTYYVFVTDTAGCTGIDSISITVNPNVTPTFIAVSPICSGGSLSALPTTSNNSITGTWSPALDNTTTTTYTFTPTAGLCAITTTMTITVNPNITPAFTAVSPICSGATLAALPTTSNNGITGTWSPGINNTATTIYTFTPSVGQCAITTTITITVNPIVTTNLSNETVCQGDSVLIFGNYQTVAGNYYDTLIASTGCDSILVKQLIVNPIYNQNLGIVTICQGDSALILGNYQTVAGTYFDTLTSINGCDSIVSQTLNVSPSHNVNLNNDTAFCAGNSLLLDAGVGASSYQWINGVGFPYNQQTFSVSSTGTYYVVTTLGACTTSDTINITVNPIITTNLTNEVVCQGDSALIFGNYQTVAGNYYDTLTASTGCDSILVKQLIVNPTYNQNLGTVTICQGDSALILGNYQTVAGTYFVTLTSINGCDSIVSQTLNVSPTYIINTNATICEGDSILLGGIYQTVAGVYNDTLASVNGCDSLTITTLMVNPIAQDTIAPVIICQGDSALMFGAYQSVAGTYQGFYSGINTCDSIVSQELIVNPLPIINLGMDTSLCENDSIYLDAGINLESYVWNNGDTSQVILVDAATLSIGSYIYSVQGTDSNGCTSVDSITIQITVCVGIEEEQSDNLFYNLFPNPTKGEVTLTSNKTIIGIEIFNVIGEKVMNEQVMRNSYQFNIEKLVKGVYFVKIAYEKENRVTRLVLN